MYPFLLAWDLKAQPGTFGSFSYNDFENTLRPLKYAILSLSLSRAS